MTRALSPQRRPIFNYENALLILLGLSFGFASSTGTRRAPSSPTLGCLLCFFLVETAPVKETARC
jgi:hypothetical protein